MENNDFFLLLLWILNNNNESPSYNLVQQFLFYHLLCLFKIVKETRLNKNTLKGVHISINLTKYYILQIKNKFWKLMQILITNSKKNLKLNKKKITYTGTTTRSVVRNSEFKTKCSFLTRSPRLRIKRLPLKDVLTKFISQI